MARPSAPPAAKTSAALEIEAGATGVETTRFGNAGPIIAEAYNRR
jgi:hypothetical protein